jgi:biopolymer transport protein ExbD
MKIPIKATSSEIGLAIRMTPLIDVIFLLLIFFILTIRLQKDFEIVKLRIKLVQEERQFKIYLQERVVYTYKDLLSYLNMLPEEIMIVIEPEPKVPYKYVIGIYNTCLKAKQSNIVFSITSQ